MQHTEIEQLDALERRVGLMVGLAEVEAKVARQLKQIARSTRVAGFRPGKVPMDIVVRQHGAEVRQEVLERAIGEAFADVVNVHGLRVAGYPRIEPKPEVSNEGTFECYAVFEVYPDIVLGDLSGQEIVRPVVEVGETEVDNTLTVLSKQRASWQNVTRAAQMGDRLTVDFVGTIDGTPFDGGEAKGFLLEIGAGRTLPEFEQGLLGASAGETRQVMASFPADYQANHLAGKTAQFDIVVQTVTEAVLPAIDAEFAMSLGIADGDVAVMRAEILSNLQREAANRVQARVRQQIWQALMAVTPFEPPKALVQEESRQLLTKAEQDMRARGMDIAGSGLSLGLFENQAKQRVMLGLIVSHVIQAQQLTASADQMASIIDALAQSYEEPENVVAWYRQSPERMQEIRAQALENQVVEWVLDQVKVRDEPMTFATLMEKEQA